MTNKKETIAELSDITFFGRAKLRQLTAENSAKIPPDWCTSLSEHQLVKLIKKMDNVSKLINHNRTHMSRAYPAGHRVECSNYNPVYCWASGVQMVALNYQTDDVFKRMCMGKFRENGNCGYVLKPGYMRARLGNAPPISRTASIKIWVHVISAQNLPKISEANEGVIDPYISLCLSGPKEDAKELESGIVNSNGFNPVFNQVFAMKVLNPDVSILTFQAMHKGELSDTFLGFSSVPISCLRAGFRSVPLLDKNGKKFGDVSYASLFVRIAIEQLVMK